MELIDYESFYVFTVSVAQHRKGAYDRSDHATPVNIANQQRWNIGRAGKTQIGVEILEVVVLFGKFRSSIVVRSPSM